MVNNNQAVVAEPGRPLRGNFGESFIIENWIRSDVELWGSEILVIDPCSEELIYSFLPVVPILYIFVAAIPTPRET